MEIRDIAHRAPRLIQHLTELWEASVRSTHTFLSEEEIQRIKAYVPRALGGVAHLVVAEEDGAPAAFMGIEDAAIEMLFVAPEKRGMGLGKRLVEYGAAHYAVETLAVNEQNPQARGFYEHLGFRVYKRTETDEQGGPYPLLYMRLQ